MKTKLIVFLAVLFAIVQNTPAQITLQDPVITDSYIKFVGENETNNYRFTLDTYEWADRGPQFQLTIEPLDASKPAQFTVADLSDPNYWEPMFRLYTKQMAGEEMTAQDNVKRLYVKNVAIIDNQFHDYQEFHIISIEASGDYSIPKACFSGCTHLETLDCNVQGTLTLGGDIVNTQPSFTVKVYTSQSAQAWKEYKEKTEAHFTVDDSEVVNVNAPAQIVLQDPVITDSYIKFVGENTANNYRFTLDTYEWADRGPQFQLTIEPLDASKPAQFTAADLSDPNYWEPMFRLYTKQMAGEEMTAQNNVKRLYVKNVAVLDNQFHDYQEFHIISIEASGDYSIPKACFSGCTKLETFDCNVQGTLTLGGNIVNAQPAFTVKVYTSQCAQAWKEYKENTESHFTVDDSGLIDTKIVLQDPVITDSYIKFVGENTANNYRFTLDTYEWADRGPQFQITIEPLDASKPAQFTAADLSDPNYWEPMFRLYTKQMAGEEMTAQNNVKRLYVKNVAVLDNQFHDYQEFHIISIEASGDYSIPKACFSGCTKLETFDCNVQGTLTLGGDIVNAQPAFTVKVYTSQSAQAWKEYKENTESHFTVDDSGLIDTKIVLQDPVITDSYIKFVGENTANNYRFTLDTYEWADRGPQFQITIEPLDASKPAQFTAADLSDPNYWEPMFRLYTKQMAGEEMTAQNNVKRLYVKNVAVLDNQFHDYENFKIISIEASGDYSIPKACFSGCTKLETFDCNVQGTLTLGGNIVNAQPAFTVKVYTSQCAQVWKEYKENTESHFTVDDSEVVDINTPRILSVNLDLTVNGESRIFDLSDQGGKQTENTSITQYVLNGFKTTTSGDVSDLFLEYSVFPASQSGQQHEWKQLHATKKGENAWAYTGSAVNVLEGLQNNTEYRLEFSFNTDYNDTYGRAHYPTDGQTVRIAFTTGDIPVGISNVKATANMDGKFYDLSGRHVVTPGKGIFIVNGKKILIK